MTATALLVTIAVWASPSASTLVTAFRCAFEEISGEWRLVLAGMLAVALGVVLLAAPASERLRCWVGSAPAVASVCCR